MVAGIPPDISYGLECSVECLSITSDVIVYYHMFNETPLAPIVDAREGGCTPEGLGESLRGLARLYMRLYNDWYWTKASTLERAWCVASAAERFPRIAGEAADFLVTKFISEMLARDLDPSLRRNQQNWFDRSREMTHIEKVMAQLARKASVVPADLLGDVIRRPSDFFTSLGDISLPRSCLANMDTGLLVNGVRQKLLPSKKKKKREKQKVLKKSAAFLSTLIEPNDVTMFVGGKEIRVEGYRHVFVIGKDNILSTNHGAISIKVLDRETDRRLFNLCWYVSDTPALDQLAALVMAVRAGDEDEIIRVGNMLRVDQSAIAELRPDLLFEPYLPCAPDDLICSGTVGPPGPLGLVFPDDDALMHLTKGTTEFHHSNPSVYLDFARRFKNRLKSVRGAELYFVPACPTTIRPFANGRVGRELLPYPANTAIDEVIALLN